MKFTKVYKLVKYFNLVWNWNGMFAIWIAITLKCGNEIVFKKKNALDWKLQTVDYRFIGSLN